MISNPFAIVKFTWFSSFIIVLVALSSYLNLVDVRHVAFNNQVMYSHPGTEYFGDSRLNLKLRDLIFLIPFTIGWSMAGAAVIQRWWAGEYGLKAMIGFVFSASVILLLLVSTENDLLKHSVLKNLLSIPMVFGMICLLFMIGNLICTRLTRSPWSRH